MYVTSKRYCRGIAVFYRLVFRPLGTRVCMRTIILLLLVRVLLMCVIRAPSRFYLGSEMRCVPNSTTGVPFVSSSIAISGTPDPNQRQAFVLSNTAILQTKSSTSYLLPVTVKADYNSILLEKERERQTSIENVEPGPRDWQSSALTSQFISPFSFVCTVSGCWLICQPCTDSYP